MAICVCLCYSFYGFDKTPLPKAAWVSAYSSTLQCVTEGSQQELNRAGMRRQERPVQWCSFLTCSLLPAQPAFIYSPGPPVMGWAHPHRFLCLVTSQS